jgi:catechol 2,3-dioxygenase-like lactoylglutathione lyase family enzyme
MHLSVTDPKRSVEFYQALFGMPVQARQGATTLLRVGAGPQFIALSKTGTGAAPGISHFGMTVEGFDVDQVLAALAARGVARTNQAAAGASLSGGPLRVRRHSRGPELGGEPDGTPELFLADPGGVVFQLQAPGYCGGAGRYGEKCLAPEPSRQKGLLALRDLSHVTLRTPDPERAVRFYRETFGMPIPVYQGKTPALGVGRGPQFLMMGAAGAGANASTEPVTSAFIHHACVTVDGFDVDRVFKLLNGFGLTPRGDAQGAALPMTYYVINRMPDRGGASTGTPELYFADPDGLLIQLQDPTYCGGGGVLGERCS